MTFRQLLYCINYPFILVQRLFNPFQANVPFLYSLKSAENRGFQWFWFFSGFLTFSGGKELEHWSWMSKNIHRAISLNFCRTYYKQRNFFVIKIYVFIIFSSKRSKYVFAKVFSSRVVIIDSAHRIERKSFWGDPRKAKVKCLEIVF